MVVVGQNVSFTADDYELLNELFKRSNCIFSIEHLSNLECNGCVNTYPISEMRGGDGLFKLMPDLVLSVGNNLTAYNLKPFLRLHYKKMENWLITESGNFRDAYKSLRTIFEMPFSDFLKRILHELPSTHHNSGGYYREWMNEISTILIPEFPFSNLYVASKVAITIPEKSILHLAVLNSARIMQFFSLSRNVRTYCNVGGLGIDGCFSTFAGQAASTNELAYLIIGDLSFFYDMNAAGLRSIGPNVRVILLNNCGGSEFHFFIGKDKISSINDYISAEHTKVAAGWAVSLGYEYYCASSKEEFDSVIQRFREKSDKPMFLEVLTDMEEDAKLTKEFYGMNVSQNARSKAKRLVKSVLSDKTLSMVKKVINTVKR